MFYLRRVVIGVCLVTIVGLPTCRGEGPQATAAPRKTGEAAVDLAYLPAGAFAAGIAYPHRVLTAPNMQLAPIEIISAASVKSFGFDAVDVESLLVLVEPPTPMPGVGAVVRFSKPHRATDLFPILQKDVADAQIDGHPYRRSTSPFGPSFIMPDDRTLIIAMEPTLRRMLAAKKNPADSELKRRIQAVEGDPDLFVIALMEPVRDLVNGLLRNVPIPPPFAEARKIPNLLAAAELDLSVTPGFSVALTLSGRDEAATAEIERIVNKSLETGRQLFLQQLDRPSPGDEVAEATSKYLQRISNVVVNALRPVRKKDRLLLAGHGEMVGSAATIGVLTALLLPAVQAARGAARRTQSKNNLKQMALAMHNYHDTQFAFPTRAVFDPNGKPLLSWRVLLLPYLDQNNLYQQFKLDEPWDSPHNKKLIEQMPTVYTNPNVDGNPDFKTNYLVPVGPGTMFEGKKGVRISDITDGTSNTILIVEANVDRRVIWTKPDDLPYDPAHPMNGLGEFRPEGFLAALADGSVQLISRSIDVESLRALFTYKAGDRAAIPLGP